jgi:hypothetical protein
MSRPPRVLASSAGPPHQHHGRSHSQDDRDSAARKLISWRPIGAAATSIGAPVGVGLLHPMLGAAVFLTELAVSLIILGTALFGAKEYSERAFRLLRWIADRPEPEAPTGNTTGQMIGHSAGPSPVEGEQIGPAVMQLIPVLGTGEDGEPKESPAPGRRTYGVLIKRSSDRIGQ